MNIKFMNVTDKEFLKLADDNISTIEYDSIIEKLTVINTNNERQAEIMKNKKQTEFRCDYGKLSSLLADILREGYTEEDYTNFEFETDYSDCYYEGDSPSIVCKYNK
jgi:hypothetical protein